MKLISYIVGGLFLIASCGGTTDAGKRSGATSNSMQPSVLLSTPKEREVAARTAAGSPQPDAAASVRLLLKEPTRARAMMDTDFIDLMIRADGGDPKTVDFAAGFERMIAAIPKDCVFHFQEDKGYSAVAVAPPMSDQSPQRQALIAEVIDNLKAGSEVLVYCTRMIQTEECDEADENEDDELQSNLVASDSCVPREEQQDELLFGVNLYRGKIRAWMVNEAGPMGNLGSGLPDFPDELQERQ